jgi:hypothetical protein
MYGVKAARVQSDCRKFDGFFFFFLVRTKFSLVVVRVLFAHTMGLAPQPPAFRGGGSKNNFCNLLVLGFSLVVVFSFRGFSFVTGIKISEVMTGKVQQ